MGDFFPAEFVPGSNAMGLFTIGVSPIGTIDPFVWQDTVISQYANSARLLGLIENFDSYLDQTENMDAFFDNIWNIDTAVGYGLDVWGRILGVKRTLQVPSGRYLGFNEAGVFAVDGFNQSPFYAGAPITSNYDLTDDAYRVLLLAKALANICDGSIPAINRLLMLLFAGRGNAYVTEGIGSDYPYLGFGEALSENIMGFGQAQLYAGESFGLMQMTYTFKFQLTPVEVAIVNQSNVLPTPCGVLATIVISP